LKSIIPSSLKYLALIIIAVLGEFLIRSLSSGSPDEFYNIHLLLGTVAAYLLFGLVLGSDAIAAGFRTRSKLEIDIPRLSLGLATLIIFATIGFMGLFEPGNNFSPNGVFQFVLKGKGFTALFLTLSGYFISSSFRKSDRMF